MIGFLRRGQTVDEFSIPLALETGRMKRRNSDKEETNFFRNTGRLPWHPRPNGCQLDAAGMRMAVIHGALPVEAGKRHD
jgi:hypothetical protein